MKIYILRHGTTEWNAKHLIQGQTDTPLDDFGKLIAKETGKNLKKEGIKFDRVFSSPLMRAYKTAELVLENLDSGSASRESATSASVATVGPAIITDDRLKELHFGFMDGGKVEEMLEKEDSPFRYFKSAPDKYEEEIIKWRKENPGNTSLNPELLSEMCERARDFMVQEIEKPLRDSMAEGANTSDSNAASLTSDSTVLISAHGALSKALLMYINSETDLSKFWGCGLLPNCGVAIAELTMDGGKPVYRIINEATTFYADELEAQAPKLL